MAARDGDLDPPRTVVVSGVPGGVLPPSRLVDKLTIHFLSRRRSDGRDVETVRYPTGMDGVAFVTFHHSEDADRVVRKEQQVLTDSEIPQAYVLTVFPFSRDVFLYVSSAAVDLSFFHADPDWLIETLRSTHRSVRFTPSSQHGRASIEGPFKAVRALRDDLIRRARRPESPWQKDSAKLRAASPKPKVTPAGHTAPEASRSPPSRARTHHLSLERRGAGRKPVDEEEDKISAARPPHVHRFCYKV